QNLQAILRPPLGGNPCHVKYDDIERTRFELIEALDLAPLGDVVALCAECGELGKGVWVVIDDDDARGTLELLHVLALREVSNRLLPEWPHTGVLHVPRAMRGDSR